ncbi:MAG TPA: 50S ribosomal protein L10 [Tepidisphaeraceae bacterium]|jgi:large subunit ribosomal protein L10
MSKTVKSLIMKELTAKLGESDAVAVINPRGIDAIKNNNIRRKLHDKGVKMTVVKNTLAKKTLGEGKLKGFDTLLDGPSAVIYGKASIAEIARVLLDEKKNIDALELRGIFFDGEVYAGEKGVEQVSKLPTREEAIGLLVAALMGPGKKLAGALKGPGGKLGGILKSIEDKAKERGDAAPAAEEAAPAAAAPEAAAPAADAPPAA